MRLITVCVLLLLAATAVASEPTEAERKAASWACQMAMIRPDGTMPPEAPCVCRARVGLPESKACKRDRAKRKG